MSIKSYIIAGAVLFVVVFFCPSFSASAGQDASKVGVIYLQKAVIESAAGKEATARFEKEIEIKKAVIAAKDKEISALKEDLRNTDALKAVSARKIKEEKLEDALKCLRQLKLASEEELRKIQYDLTIKIVRDIFEIARQLGVERKYDLIVQVGPQVVYTADSADITDEIIKRYDAQKKN